MVRHLTPRPDSLLCAALAADLDALAPAAACLGVDPLEWVLGGGEEHALVACFPAAVPAGWREIGSVREGPATVRVDGRDWTGYAGWWSAQLRMLKS